MNPLISMALYSVKRVKDFLSNSDYDVVQVGCSLSAIWCGWVLSTDTKYMEQFVPMQELLRHAPQWLWMNTLYGIGALQGIIFLLSGTPGYFANDGDHRKFMLWSTGCILFEVLCVDFWAALSIYMNLVMPTWAAGFFGIMALGCSWAALRIGDRIAKEGAYVEAVKNIDDVDLLITLYTPKV